MREDVRVRALAFVGLGAMGARMARRLLDAGHALVVWNRDPAKTVPLVDAGATAATTPAAATRGAEVVIVMVADPAALAAVSEGADGIAAGASASTVVVQMSTAGRAAVERLAAALPEGAQVLDAPVLGSLVEAESGTLRIFAGGPAELVERLEPVLSRLGSVLHVGDVGAGSAAKLVANGTLFAVLGALGEALALAEGLGLERDVAFQVLAATPLAAQAERRRPAIESGEYPPRFELALALKDANLVAEAAAQAGVELRVGEAARSWLADADASGLGRRDYAAALERILRAEPR